MLPTDQAAAADDSCTTEPGGGQHPLPAGLVLELARAIVRPGGNALLITSDNTSVDRRPWVPLDQAAGSGRCWAVEVAGDVLALDADSPALGHAAEQVADELERLGLRPVVVASGRPGHRHVICRVPDRRIHASLIRRARAAGLDVRAGRGQTIRPPLVPHRSGLPVRLLRPDTPEQALAALRSPPGAAARTRRRRGRLGTEAWALLRRGRVRGSRSQAEMSIVLSAYQAGWTLAEVRDELLDPRNAGGDRLRERLKERGDLAVHRYLQHLWTKAAAYASAHPPVDRTQTRAALAGMREEMDRHAWPGQAGASDYDALEALISLGVRACRLELRVSERQLADAAGMVRQTARAALRRLAEAGWIRQVAPGLGDHASMWKLLPDRDRPRHQPLLPQQDGEQDPPAGPSDRLGDRPELHVAHDTWRWRGMGNRGLGPTGRRVLAALLAAGDEGADAVQIAGCTGLHVATVRRRLRDADCGLLAVGLVEQLLDGTYRAIAVVDHEVLDQVAELLGTAGAGAKQRDRHETERRSYIAALQALQQRYDRDTGDGLVVDRVTGELRAQAVGEGQLGAHGPPGQDQVA